MSGRELDQHVLILGVTDPAELRAAALAVADYLAAEHPHPLDDLMPKLAGRELAKDPVVADEVRDLLATLGLRETP